MNNRDGNDRDGERTDAPRREGRTTAEWMLFGLCLAVVTGIAALVVWLWVSGDETPPRFTVTVGAVELLENGDVVYPVRVRNTGTQTAAKVMVVARNRDDEPLAHQTIDYVSGGETTDVTFILPEREVRTTFEVVGFQEP